MSNETQQAVNLTVNRTTPIRAGSYPGPYRIINESLTATVWVSDNTSVGQNQGTSVNPGTSLQWTKSGDLFICLGTDEASLEAGSASVILSYDVSDWQPNPVAISTAILNSGVIITDRPVVAFNGQVADGNTTPAIPVDRYSSVVINLSQSFCPNLSYATLTWYDTTGTNIISQQQIWFAPNPSIPWEWNATLPAVGSYLRISVSAPPIYVIDVRIILSNRQVESMNQSLPRLFAQEPNIARASLNLGVGATLSLTTHPWFGDVQIDSYLSVGGLVPNLATYSIADWATSSARFIGLVTSNNQNATNYNINVSQYQLLGGTAATFTHRVPMWGSPLVLTVVNQSGLVMTLRVQVTPIRINP